MHGTTIAVGTDNIHEVGVYTDSGTQTKLLNVPNVNSIAMNEYVLVAEDKSNIYVFQKISGQWTQTQTTQPLTINNIAMYSRFIVVGRIGTG